MMKNRFPDVYIAENAYNDLIDLFDLIGKLGIVEWEDPLTFKHDWTFRSNMQQVAARWARRMQPIPKPR